MITRRGFLKSIAALFVAPAIVRAESLMPIVAKAKWVAGPGGILTQTLGWMAVPISNSCWVENDLIDVTTICDSAKEFIMGLPPRAYQDIKIPLVPGAHRMRIDGVESCLDQIEQSASLEIAPDGRGSMTLHRVFYQGEKYWNPKVEWFVERDASS